MIKDIFNYTKNLLNEVIFNDVPFAIAAKQKLKKDTLTQDYKKLVSVLAGCELRHHLVFSEVIKTKFNDLDNELYLYLLVALTNNLFIKHFPYEEVIDFIYDLFLKANMGLSREELKEFFNSNLDTKELIPEKYHKESNDFLSLRFNTPNWLVKMWRKAYGNNLTFKILKANTKAPKQTVRINTNLISKEEVLAKDTIYSESFVDNVVLYHGNLPFNKQKYIEDFKVFPQKMGYKFIVDKIGIDPLQGVAIYQGMSSNFYLEVALRGMFSMPIDLILSTHQDYYFVKNNINNFKINNLKAYYSDYKSIITCVSKKVNSFFVLPKCSNFELLRSAPDYFLRFKPETLDSLILEQYQTLVECSSFVEDNGQLIYIIPTLSTKEGHANIVRFLKENKGFALEEERQLFPFDPYDSSIYYAILRKVNIDND